MRGTWTHDQLVTHLAVQDQPVRVWACWDLSHYRRTPALAWGDGSPSKKALCSTAHLFFSCELWMKKICPMSLLNFLTGRPISIWKAEQEWDEFLSTTVQPKPILQRSQITQKRLEAKKHLFKFVRRWNGVFLFLFLFLFFFFRSQNIDGSFAEKNSCGFEQTLYAERRNSCIFLYNFTA